MEHSDKIQLISNGELRLRADRLCDALTAVGADSMLISDNATILYLTGRVFAGYIYINCSDRRPFYIVRRPSTLKSDRMCLMSRFDDLVKAVMQTPGIVPPRCLGLEFDIITYNLGRRLIEAFGVDTTNASPAVRAARAVKTPEQQRLLRISGEHHRMVYARIPSVYQEGMTDHELEVEIERLSRLEGCLGIFRVNGSDMEIFMGNVITGDNADIPSPYDFAMGGGGLDPSLPVGADGSMIYPRSTVMVDVNGNYTGYMTDMTRCFACGEVAQEARRAHQLSVDIVDTLTDMARPGVEARALYEKAIGMVEAAGLTRYFMGHRTHAGFVGHGVGIEINEAPVIAPRSRDILQAGNVIALEPKFVIPGTGAVGIENTIIVHPQGPAECITKAPTELIQLI